MRSLFNLGFRPFFLFGAAWSALQILVWLSYQIGWMSQVPFRDPLVWHAHEMIFGFVTAIVAGFILTASQNWSGVPGVRGSRLLALAGLWGAARLLSIFWNKAELLFALVDLAFFPALSLCLVPYLWRKGQEHNKIFFLLFFALFLFNLLVHLHVLGMGFITARSALLGAVYFLLVLTSLIAGRVLPFFSGVAVPQAKPVQLKWLEVLCHGSLALFALMATFAEFSAATVAVALVAACAHGARLFLWHPWRTVHVPILFVLYIAYAWIPVGLVLRALASLAWVPPSAATHAFTAGVLGMMTYGMMSRVALGHTGRPMRAGRATVAGYAALFLAALARVLGPLVNPGAYGFFIQCSAGLWVLAFSLFLFVYAPILSGPRADGKPG